MRGKERPEYLGRPYAECPLLQFLDGRFHPDWRLDDADAHGVVARYRSEADPAKVADLASDIRHLLGQIGDQRVRELVVSHIVHVPALDRSGLEPEAWLLWLHRDLGGLFPTSAAFDEHKRRILAAASPSHGDNLMGMAIDFDHFLAGHEVIEGMDEAFDNVSVRETGDPTRLLAAAARARQGVGPDQAAAALEWIWWGHLRYRFFEAHVVTVGGQGVALDGITQISDGGFFVTARIDVSVTDSEMQATPPESPA